VAHDPASADARNRVLVTSLAWVASARWASQLVRWISTIAMAKLLLPADYGIVGMAAVVVGFVNQVAEFGLGSAVVQHRDLSRTVERRLAGAAVLIALGLAVLTAATAPFVAAFFSQEALLLVLPAFGVRFVIDAFGSVPRGLLARELRFRELAMFEVVESIAMAFVGLTTAYVTRSYWALVAANLASSLVVVTLAMSAAPVRPRWPGRVDDLRDLLTFGRDLVLSRLAWFSFSNADFVVVGRLLGKDALGAYTLAWSIASAPAEKFAGLVLKVAPAILSDARQHAGEVRRMFLVMVQGVALIIFPLAIGLALLAHPLVHVVLGPQWAESVGPLRLLALAFILRSLATLEPVVLLSRRETYLSRNMMALFAVVAPIAFVLFARWGLTGVAAVWLCVIPALSLPLYARYVWRKIGVTWGDWLRAIWPAFSSAAVMALAVQAIAASNAIRSPLALMAAQIAGGAAVYAGMLWIAHRRAADAVLRLARRNRRSPVAVPATLSPGSA
jgi:O-antigen/teichoic acid export membrane protein